KVGRGCLSPPIPNKVGGGCPSPPQTVGLMKCTLAAIALAFVFTGAAQQPPPATSLAELQERLSNHVSQPRFAAAMWGVKVVSLDTGKTLFEHNPQKLFSPASNSKLYTVALALDRLGADY